MTSTIPQAPVAHRSPRTILVIRILVGVQAAVAFVGLSMLGLIAAWGIGLLVSGYSDNLGAVVGLIALPSALFAFTYHLLRAAGRLRRGQESARITLVALQSVLLVAVLLLTRVVGGFLDFAGFPAPALVLGVTAVGALAALVAPATRRWCRS